MSDDDDRWRGLIREAIERGFVPVNALTALKRVGGYSQAARIDCDDGRRYVVKGVQVGRALVAEQVVGRLGRVIGAPVAEVGLVNVSADLIEASFSVMHFDAGVGHGSVFIEGCYDGWEMEHLDEEENRERYALLAVLYGWTQAADHQFLYRKTPPHLVYSVDHGHFLEGGPEWTTASLLLAPNAIPDHLIASSTALSRYALHTATSRLQGVGDEDIAEAVAAPPESWGMLMHERIALAGYLAHRRDDLLASVDLAS